MSRPETHATTYLQIRIWELDEKLKQINGAIDAKAADLMKDQDERARLSEMREACVAAVIRLTAP